MLRLHLWATYVYSNFNTTILHTNMHMLTFYESIRKYEILYLFIVYAHNTLGWKLISTFRQFNREVYYRCHRIHWLGLIDRKQRISYWISTLLKQLNRSTFIQKPISSNQRFCRSYASDRVLRSMTLEKISSIPSGRLITLKFRSQNDREFREKTSTWIVRLSCDDLSFIRLELRFLPVKRVLLVRVLHGFQSDQVNTCLARETKRERGLLAVHRSPRSFHARVLHQIYNDDNGACHEWTVT